ncbi:MAG: DnaJ C-terminal domain-containing protein [Isosphaeraceae bacterium]
MADRDFYEILGVARDATADQIKKAYRNQARKNHPDVNPGDKAAEARFKEAQEAYEILSDKEKRKLYDQFGRAAFQGAGAGSHGPGPEWFARGGPGAGGEGAGFENIDFSQFFGAGGPAGATAEGGGGIFEELLGRMRGGRSGKARPRAARPQHNVEATVTIPFLTAVKGGETPLQIQRGQGPIESLNVKIPPGIKPGSKIRLRGRGESIEGEPPGDLIVAVEVQPHPYFQREASDLLVDVPITIGEAVLGAKVEVPTLDGFKVVTIPAGASTGQKLRLRGQGVPGRGDHPAGDLFAVLKVAVPKGIDDESRRLIEQFGERNPYNPRAGRW